MRNNYTKIAMFFSVNDLDPKNLAGHRTAREEHMLFVSTNPKKELESICKLLQENGIDFDIADDKMGIMGFLSLKTINGKSISVPNMERDKAFEIMENYLEQQIGNTDEMEAGQDGQAIEIPANFQAASGEEEHTFVSKTPSSLPSLIFALIALIFLIFKLAQCSENNSTY